MKLNQNLNVRIWDDLAKGVIEKYLLQTTESGVLELYNMSGTGKDGVQYPDRFVVEVSADRDDMYGIPIHVGDKIAAIPDDQNPGDFEILESEVKYKHGVFILETKSGSFKKLCDFRNEDLKVIGHVDYKHYDFFLNESVFKAYKDKSSSIAANKDEMNFKIDLYRRIHENVSFKTISKNDIKGMALVWWSTLQQQEIRAINFDFGFLRGQSCTVDEITHIFNHYIIEKKDLNSYSPV